jgi:PAS domain S-box-containing protein
VPRYEHVAADGTAREFRVHLVPVWERTVALVYERLDDSDDRQPSRQARIVFEDIVRTLHEPLAVVDTAGHLQWSNAVFAGYFGLEQTALVGSQLTALAVDAGQLALREAVTQAALRKPDDEGTLVDFKRHDGESRTCRVNARRLNSDHDDPALVLVALADETDRLRLDTLRISLIEQLVRVRDDERRSLARDLHDHVGQALTALSLHLQRLQRERDPPQRTTLIQEIQEQVSLLSADVGRLVNQMHPYRLEKLGLVEAVREHLAEFGRTHGISTDSHFTGFDEGERLPPEVEIGAFRIVQEALTNVAKHARAHSVNVVMHRKHNSLRAFVEDDGCGFEHEHLERRKDPGGLGLSTLEERVRLLGGSLSVESSRGRGTSVALSIPLSTGDRTG